MRHKSRKAKAARRGRFHVRTRVGAICLLSTTFLIPVSPATGGMAEGLAAYRAGDYAGAYAEWLPLAREGDAAAQRNVGQLYRLGRGVPQDTAVAVNWYRLAAEQGLARAQSNLAAMYLQGDGVKKDPVLAAEWLRRAAAQGHPLSQFNLGLMYETGFGLDISLVKARSWYELAASAGSTKARDRLANLRASPEQDDATLLPPSQTKRITDTATQGLILPPANPDVAREAELTRVRIAIAIALRERADLAAQSRVKTNLPPPPFARLSENTGQRLADVTPTDKPARQRVADATPTDVSATKPLPDFLRREARNDSRVPRFKPLPQFVVAEARSEKPVPEFLVDEARNDTGNLSFKPLPAVLVEAAAQEKQMAAATPVMERETLPPPPVPARVPPKPLPDFLRQEALEDTGGARFKPLPRFLVAEVQQNSETPAPPRREANSEAGPLRLKPLPPFLVEEAKRGREIAVAAARSLVEQETLPPLPRARPSKPVPVFLKREAEIPVPLRVLASGPATPDALPVAPQIIGVGALSVPPPSYTEVSPTEGSARQSAEAASGPEPELYAPQSAPADSPIAAGHEMPPVPSFLVLEAAQDRATKLAAVSASRTETAEPKPPSPKPVPPLIRNEAKEEQAARFAFSEKPEPPIIMARVIEAGAEGTLDEKPIPAFLVDEAKETRRSLVFDLARSLSAMLRPSARTRSTAIVPPTIEKAVPVFLKREAADNRRQIVAALADSRTGRRAPAVLFAEDLTAAPPLRGAPSVLTRRNRSATRPVREITRGEAPELERVAALPTPAPEFLRREAREQGQVAALSKPVPEFLKVEALLDGATFGGLKPVPAFIRAEAVEQGFVLVSAGAKPVPDLILREAAIGTSYAYAPGNRATRASFVHASLAAAQTNTRPVPVHIKLEAALEAQFANASPPPPLRVRPLLPAKPEARTGYPSPDERPTEPRSLVVLKATAREADGGPVWLNGPAPDQGLSGRVIEAGVSAYRGEDFARAYDLWLAVARRGNADAQFLVGGLHADGNGVDRDLGQAYRWWRLSGDQGHTRAQELLPTLLGLIDEEESSLDDGARGIT